MDLGPAQSISPIEWSSFIQNVLYQRFYCVPIHSYKVLMSSKGEEVAAEGLSSSELPRLLERPGASEAVVVGADIRSRYGALQAESATKADEVCKHIKPPGTPASWHGCRPPCLERRRAITERERERCVLDCRELWAV